MEHQQAMNKKENIETAKNKERKISRNWNKWDLICFVLLIILTIFVPLGGIHYLCGRLNFHIGLVICVLYPAIGVFMIYCFAGIVRLFSDWRKHNRKRKLIIVAEIVIPIVIIALFVAPFFIPIALDLWPGYKPFTYGCRDRVRSKADIEAIRAWLRTLSKENYTGDTVRLLSDEWPKSLKVLNPRRVILSTDEKDNTKIRLTMGGRFAYWGVEIGMEDMEIPPSDFGYRGEYRLPLESGVYVWYDLQ